MRKTHRFNPRAAAGVLLVALAVASGSEARKENAWVSFASKEGRFSIEFPSSPVRSETHQKSFIGTITNHVFTSESDERIFTVDYSDIPHFALDFAGAETIYEHAKGALLQKTFGKQRSYSDATISHAQGKRLVYDTPPAPGYPPMRGDAVLVLVGTRLYVIDAVAPEAEADSGAKRFLSSASIAP